MTHPESFLTDCNDEYVRSFKVEVSEDGVDWTLANSGRTATDTNTVFETGFVEESNWLLNHEDSDLRSLNAFHAGLMGRYVRITPLTHHNRASMRAGLWITNEQAGTVGGDGALTRPTQAMQKIVKGGMGGYTACMADRCIWDDNLCAEVTTAAEGRECGMLESEAVAKCGAWDLCQGVQCHATEYGEVAGLDMMCVARAHTSHRSDVAYWGYAKTVLLDVSTSDVVPHVEKWERHVAQQGEKKKKDRDQYSSSLI